MTRRLRILYAEDMKELRDIVGLGLMAEGHEFDCAEDGAEAYQKIAADPAAYDVVISDHHMPRMNGLALVRRLRALPFPAKIIIFCSELGEEASSAYAELSVDKVLYKPVDLGVLRALMLDIASTLPIEPTAIPGTR